MANTKRRARTVKSEATDSSWTFFTNHTHVVVFLSLHGDTPLKEVASAIGITERAVQKIIRELEAAGVVTIEKVGRRNTYTLNRDAHLRHPLEGHCTIGEVLSVILRRFARKGLLKSTR